MSQIARPFNVMAKPVCGVCNLDCTYCYYTSKPRELYPGVTRFMMGEDVLRRFVGDYLQAMPVQANVGWQGGEPLLAGKDFFRRAVQFQKDLGREGQLVANALQTNGTLLDDEWCEFLAEHKFLVGISLDGPPEWHDSFRRDHAGKGSFHRAWAGLELLRKHGVEFNILVTLNSRNAHHAGDIYRYFVNRGVCWLQFIPVLEKDPAGRPMDFSCTGPQFGKFMLEVFDLWRGRHVGVVSERLIDSVLHTLVHGVAAQCCNADRCANSFVLEFNGDLYACDHYVYKRWLLGNIMETPLADLARSPKLEEFAALKTDLPAACRSCEFLDLCRGGCPKHHVPSAETHDPARVNHFCEGYKLFFRQALPELRRVADYVKQGRLPPPPTPHPSHLTGEDGKRVPPPAAGPLARAPVGIESSPPRRNDPCSCGSGRKYKLCCGRR